MKGTERGPNNTLRYFYQYKAGGTKYYYERRNHGQIRLPFKRPFIPNCKAQNEDREPRHEYHEYVPAKPQGSKIEIAFRSMPEQVRNLITTWLLIMGFQTLNDLSVDAINKSFRKQSLIHHPDRGGLEESYKALTNVRDHLLTICSMAAAMR